MTGGVTEAVSVKVPLNEQFIILIGLYAVDAIPPQTKIPAVRVALIVIRS